MSETIAVTGDVGIVIIFIIANGFVIGFAVGSVVGWYSRERQYQEESDE